MGSFEIGSPLYEELAVLSHLLGFPCPQAQEMFDSVWTRKPALLLGMLWALAGTLLIGAANADEPIDYERQVKPLLKERCYACHGALKQQARLRLDTAASMLEGGFGGPVIEPGHADESLLIDRVIEPDDDLRMPPEGSPLTEDQIVTLRAWIEQGAPTPEAEAPEEDPREHWAFQPIERPDVPAGHAPEQSRNPIDAFLAAEHQRRDLIPLPPADPNVRLRRLYLDLIGLPPTREELHAFLEDPSDESYEQVVDRLLASPQYGERWGRHWMDVWRYSDWYGRRSVPDVLNSYAMIWRWRDWIVRSLNEDKPYDRMVHEMLAADELAPTEDENLVATGFLVRNWYRWNYNTWMKESVEHTSKAFLALTINCAHCHDHKYDPISHEDYFKFRAFFEPLELRHDRIPGEPDPGPYPKYDYGKSYPPITSGMVRVFDEKLDAETFFYTKGEERNIVPGREPIPPGVPNLLGGRSFEVEPVELPVEASYPGLKDFIRREELASREAAVAEAEATLAKAREQLAAAEQRAVVEEQGGCVETSNTNPLTDLDTARLTLQVDEATLAGAQAELEAIQARIVADDARFGKAEGDAEALSRAASKAERAAGFAMAKAELARANREVIQATQNAQEDPSTEAEMEKAEQQVEAAGKALEAAQIALEEESNEYTPLSPSYPRQSTGRRSALAHWITSRDNPLAARVAVNHIWRWHFGTPLVATTADFGRNGARPTHPELLDWLAVELMEPSTTGVEPWSFKALHRLIVTSAAYQMQSHTPDLDHPNRTLDPENRWYWRYTPDRMEAEVIRDSLLHVAGELDPTIGGPDIDFDQGLTSRRRSIYFTHHGEAKMTMLELFDAPNPIDCYERTSSVVPQQALALTNNDLALEMSRHLAEQLWNELESEEPDRASAFIVAAFEHVLTRPPTAQEVELALAFLDRQIGLFEATEGQVNPMERARRNLVHALLNHNDFLTVH